MPTNVKGIEITVLSEHDIATVAPARADIVRIIERTYRAAAAGRAEVPAKIGVHPDFPASFCHVMPAWVEAERALGMKWITYYPGNAARGLADSTGIIILNDPDSGMPVAVMEGMWITYARTTACAAVAARHLARPGSTRLGLIGCGGLGTWSLRMFSEVFPDIAEVRVSSRRSQSREAFCRNMAAEVESQLIPASGNEEVVRESDIVISSISKADTPQALEAWWPAGSLAIPLDVTRCWDSAAFARADRLLSDGYESLVRSASRYRPDLQLSEERHVRLEDVVAGRVQGRMSASDRIMAVPTGVASVDMTLAWEIFRNARTAGLGKHVRLT